MVRVLFVLRREEEQEEEEEEAAPSSNLLSAFAASPEATTVFVYVFADFWNDFFCGVTSSAAYGSSGADLPTHCAWATGFYCTAPISCWIVLFSWSL